MIARPEDAYPSSRLARSNQGIGTQVKLSRRAPDLLCNLVVRTIAVEEEYLELSVSQLNMHQASTHIESVEKFVNARLVTSQELWLCHLATPQLYKSKH